jgi:tetratricopeptide (TPR) repeat protein
MCGWLLCALALSSGCERPASEHTTSKPDLKRRVFGHAAKPAKSPPVTLEDCQQIAMAIHGCFADENIAAADMLIDWDAILNKAARGEEIPDAMRPQLIHMLTGDQGFFGSLEPEITAGGSFNMLRIHFDRSGSAGIWFRLTLRSGLRNYYDLQLARGPDGDIRVRDIFVAAFGDTISNTFQPVIAHALYDPRRVRADLRERSDRYFAGVAQLAEMRRRMNSHNFAGAMQIYHRFPEQFKSPKGMITLRLMCALSLDRDEQLAALEFAESHNYPAGALDSAMAPVYLKLGNFDAANRCIDRLNRLVGGDADLSNDRIKNLLAAGRTAEARRDSDLAIWMEPYSGPNLLTALAVAQRQHDFPRMVDLLTVLEAGGLKLPEFEGNPFYAEFVRSQEYQAWIAQRRAEAAPSAAGEDEETAEVAAEYSAWPRVQ